MLTFEIPGLKLVKVEITDEVEVDLPGSHFLREIVTNQFFVCWMEPKSYWNSLRKLAHLASISVTMFLLIKAVDEHKDQ